MCFARHKWRFNWRETSGFMGPGMPRANLSRAAHGSHDTRYIHIFIPAVCTRAYDIIENQIPEDEPHAPGINPRSYISGRSGPSHSRHTNTRPPPHIAEQDWPKLENNFSRICIVDRTRWGRQSRSSTSFTQSLHSHWQQPTVIAHLDVLLQR